MRVIRYRLYGSVQVNIVDFQSNNKDTHEGYNSHSLLFWPETFALLNHVHSRQRHIVRLFWHLNQQSYIIPINHTQLSKKSSIDALSSLSLILSSISRMVGCSNNTGRNALFLWFLRSFIFLLWWYNWERLEVSRLIRGMLCLYILSNFKHFLTAVGFISSPVNYCLGNF